MGNSCEHLMGESTSSLLYAGLFKWPCDHADKCADASKTKGEHDRDVEPNLRPSPPGRFDNFCGDFFALRRSILGGLDGLLMQSIDYSGSTFVRRQSLIFFECITHSFLPDRNVAAAEVFDKLGD
jgi:hypothetical protein